MAVIHRQVIWKHIRENLKSGKDSIIEIPKERSDYELYYDPDKNKPNKSYSKWGGFIDNVDKFDSFIF